MSLPDCMMPDGAEPCKAYQRLTTELAAASRGKEAITLLAQIERCLVNGMTPAQILLGNSPIRCALIEFAANKPSGMTDPLEGVSQDAIDGGWTAKGLIAHAKKVEAELAAAKRDAERLQAAVKPFADLVMTTSGRIPHERLSLALLVGDQPLVRTEITKKIWDYIKKHKLQDSVNKRIINADATMQAALKCKKSITMFEMTKLVGDQLDKKPATKKSK